MSYPLTAIILAAGKGTRMKSTQSKVLHEACGKPMLSWVIEGLQKIGVPQIGLILPGPEAEYQEFAAMTQKFPSCGICVQHVRNGTASAVASCGPFFFEKENQKPHYSTFEQRRGFLSQLNCNPNLSSKSRYVLICFGDVPAMDPKELEPFVLSGLANNAPITVMGAKVPDPTGYGRLIQDSKGGLLRIVEEKDASSDEKKISIINTGTLLADVDVLFNFLKKIEPKNQQQEYYLTDVIGLAAIAGLQIGVYLAKDWKRWLGVNTPEQLKDIEGILCAES